MSIQYITLSSSAYDAVIFDMDGVVTKTARVHFKAWKRLFDEYLKNKSGENQSPFNEQDYRRYVDGKPRHRGIESFLESRGISLSWGKEDDGPDQDTIYGLGNRKNRYFNQLLDKYGVDVFEPALNLLKELRSAGFKTGIVSSSQNCAVVLKAAGVSHLFDHKTDGLDAQELNLKGKPQPDIFLYCAEKLGVKPQRTVILEDAISGVQAGKNGGFGLVIGVDRTGLGEDLKKNGAHAVVTDLSVIKVDNPSSSASDPLPSALKNFEQFALRVKNKKVALFLDYDGTLTPIVDDPDKAFLQEDMKKVLAKLADQLPVAVISGRDRADVQNLVGIENIYYAGSHGFDIAGPDKKETNPENVKDYLPELGQADKVIRKAIKDIEGAWVERKKFAIAVHYRKVEDQNIDQVKQAVEQAARAHPKLRQSGGKKIFELRPDIDWHKGKALIWLLEKLDLDKPDVLPIYLGDDVTDEDAFDTLRNRGIGVVVMDSPRKTKAGYRLKNPEEVRLFLNKIISTQKGKS
jgi:trehalose 6-phosphate phosphatase